MASPLLRTSCGWHGRRRPTSGGAPPAVLAAHAHNLLSVAREFSTVPGFDPDVGAPRAHHLVAALQHR
eukprot:15445005-Alexandrium_andersonii.AAC.1